MISIAMAAFNGEKYIQEQLDSILCQTHVDFELIVIDDCSTDTTWAILQEYKTKDARVHCYANNYNIGFKKNFEKTIALCKGEYIALADQDDIWTSDHLEVLYNSIKDNTLICSNSEFIDSESKKTGNKFRNNFNIQKTAKYNSKEYFYLMILRNFVQGCTVLFKKSALLDAFPIPDEFVYHDQWIGLFASFFGKIIYLNHVTVYYRIHENNSSKTQRIPQRNLRRKNYFLLRYNIIHTFYISFRRKFIKEQDIHCASIVKYFKSSLTKTNLFFRISFYISHYYIQFCDENTLKSLLFFSPRFIFRMFFSPRLCQKDYSGKEYI
jgi:glycosyltransferase involved in cell wall biosynthesis